MKTEDELRHDEEGVEGLPENDAEGELLRNELKEMTNVLHDSQEQNLRLKAEMDNQRKRLEREIDNARDFAATYFIAKILPVKDSMEKGLDVAYMEDGNIDAASLLEGITSTLRLLNDTFKKAGIEEINPTGEEFDPEIHEAMAIKQVEDATPNSVLSVYQKGYKLNGRLIRPARVEVSGS